jgi:hypothetical protein
MVELAPLRLARQVDTAQSPLATEAAECGNSGAETSVAVQKSASFSRRVRHADF